MTRKSDFKNEILGVRGLLAETGSSRCSETLEHLLQRLLDRHARVPECMGNRIRAAAQAFEADEFKTADAYRRKDRAQVRGQEVGLGRWLVAAIPPMGAD